MIKDILQQLAPLDEKIAALRGDPADENMTDITNHAAELAELSAQEDALLSGCGALTAEDRVFLARHPELNGDTVHLILQDEVGQVFAQVLADAGVYKLDEAGRAGFVRFLASVK